MKLAQTPDGHELRAAEGVDKFAICRYCGGRVVLRGRKVMGSAKKSYYWRHLDNQNRKCPGRARSRD
jgi:hypothetical protein